MGSKAKVKQINVNAYVNDYGQVINRITYEMNDVTEIKGLNKEDFVINIFDKEYIVLDLDIEENMLILHSEDFPYDGIDIYGENFAVVHYDFSVRCTKQMFDFNKSNCNLHTKTIDDFEKGRFQSKSGLELPYWLYCPEGASQVPLMVWEHGGGEVRSRSYEGANITKSKGATIWIESGMSTAVLSIQYPENYSFGISSKPEELILMQEYNELKYELIQSLIATGMIDQNRIYISGASSGGGAVLRFIMQYPDLFAAALPICAKDTLIPISEPYGLAYNMQGSLTIDDGEFNQCYCEIKNLISNYDISHIPIWFVQAENDPVCTSYTSKILYQVLKEMGAKKNKITMYSNDVMEESNISSLHSSWIMAFNDMNIIRWIYEQGK